MDDEELGDNPRHPDSAIRLASTVHRFHMPGESFLRFEVSINLVHMRPGQSIKCS